ncbi:MAG: hypothetical protein ABL967_19315 [Bryobacteraceae bacterium]
MNRISLVLFVVGACIPALAAPVCTPVVGNAKTCTYTRQVTFWVGTGSVAGAPASNVDYVHSTDNITSTLTNAILSDTNSDARLKKNGALIAFASGSNDQAWVQAPSDNFPAQSNLAQAYSEQVASLNQIYGTGAVVEYSVPETLRLNVTYTLTTWNTSESGVATSNIGVASVTVMQQNMSWNAQLPIGPGSYAGAMAQVASAGGWDTLFTFVNTGAVASSARLNFFDDAGFAMPLPITNAETGSTATVSTFDQTLNPGASVSIGTSGSAGQAAKIGWGQFVSPGNVSGYGIFRFPANKWEAVVPIDTRSASSYVIAFDNTGSLATGVAVANVSENTALVNVVIRNDAGAQIGTAQFSLPARGHVSFMLNQQYSSTANRRGTVEFKTTTSGVINVLGLRANGSALTTLPVLANVAAGGGSIAHVTYGGGFNSVIYLVNTGTASTSYTLSFFDEAGTAVNTSLFILNPGTPASGTSITRTLAAGAMVAINVQPQGSATTTGSAVVTSSGNVGGFEIFQWTTFGQEATVPLETRSPNAFLLAFDNTNGLTTGVAVANWTAAEVSVPVIVRATEGNILQQTSFFLPANGHTSFLLPTFFPPALERRGTVEFGVPNGSKVSVIGLRAKDDGTLTTIPIFAK